MGKSLVIVESPAKARTIAGYLGDDFVVESSIGHIRDLPQKAADIPAELKKEPWARLGVNVDAGFEPLYVEDPDKRKKIGELKKELKQADELLLATDEDREGEAIAWHLVQVLRPKVPVRRMVFHEITRDAIRHALDDTREIDQRLVDAQETRRILDRLYGYEVSPVLWKKVMPRLSAGRVQSVATRLVVERERERMRFVTAAYWDVLGTFEPGAFEARLVGLDGSRVAQGRDFGEEGTPRSRDTVVLDEARARALVEELQGAPFTVRSVEDKPYTRRPSAPFRTSTLQQEASRKLRFSSQTTMRVAQRLYENGHITYMRTDSVNLSETALTAARAHATKEHGADTVPAEPRRYQRAVANAQEAHEAIRPAGDVFRTPAELRGELSRDELALYDLIFKRTISSQMKDAAGQTVVIELGAQGRAGSDVLFRAAGTVITFPGFLLAYESSRDEPGEDDEERRLPALTVGQTLSVTGLEAQGHETSPPARYTEASLVKALEDRGIGRPSTYASIMGTILDRGYVFKKGTALVPTFLAFSVTRLLEDHFGQLVDYDFTARMEDDLDRIAAGAEERVDWLRAFYFGGDAPGLHALVTEHLDEIDARLVNSIPIPGSDIVVRVGKFGPVPRAGHGAREHPGRPGTRRADARAGRGAPRPAVRRSRARPAPRDRTRARRKSRPLRPVRHRGRRGGRGREAAHGFAVLLDVDRYGDARRRGSTAHAAAHAHGSRRRGDHRLERSVRPLREARVRDQVPLVGGATADAERGGGRGAARTTEAATGSRRGEASAARAGLGSGHEPPDRAQGRALRPLCDGRRDECKPPKRGHGRGPDPRTCRGIACGKAR